jgi:2-alkyl-3-oxoalkanoate reductase
VTVFVAGATGVLGRRVVAQLVGAGHDVAALARLDANVGLLKHLGAAPVLVDVFDPGALRRAVAGHEVVCNLATHIPSAARMGAPGAWAENDRLRRDASRNLVEGVLAAGAARYIQESIAFLYRDGGDAWIDESAPIEPVANLRSATVAESQAARVTAAGASGVVLRFAAFYGPDSHNTLDMIRLAKRRVALGAGPNAYWSSITTDDAAAAVVAAMSAPPGVYNVGDDSPVTRREFFTTLASALGVRPPHIAPAGLAKLGGAKATVMVRSQRLSNRSFVAATGWKPAFPSVREGWPVVCGAAQRSADAHRQE